MTAKHFIALADAIRATRPSDTDYSQGCIFQWRDDVNALADFCQSQNPAFKRERWLAYINGEVGPRGGRDAAGRKV